MIIIISSSTHHHKARRISKTLYHSSWPYGLSSLLTDCIKSKHLDQRQKKTTTAKFGSHYTCNPKCFKLHSCEKKFFLCVNSKFIILKKCNIYIDSVSFIQML